MEQCTIKTELAAEYVLLRITAVAKKCDDNCRLHDQTRPPAFSYKTISGNCISVVEMPKCDIGTSLMLKHGRPTGRTPSSVSQHLSKSDCGSAKHTASAKSNLALHLRMSILCLNTSPCRHVQEVELNIRAFLTPTQQWVE